MIRPAHAVENVPVFSTVSQRDAYNALQHSTSNLSIVWNHSYNIPQWIRMSDTQKSRNPNVLTFNPEPAGKVTACYFKWQCQLIEDEQGRKICDAKFDHQ